MGLRILRCRFDRKSVLEPFYFRVFRCPAVQGDRFIPDHRPVDRMLSDFRNQGTYKRKKRMLEAVQVGGFKHSTLLKWRGILLSVILLRITIVNAILMNVVAPNFKPRKN